MRNRLKTTAKSSLLAGAYFFNTEFAYTTRIAASLARGAANLAQREVDAVDPTTWEFSAFSQNGEDGIVAHLLSCLHETNRYFVEVGASDGLENNTSFLALSKKHCGLMVDGNGEKLGRAKRFVGPLNWGVDYLELFVEPGNIDRLLSRCLFREPDFFSLDIDSNDYFVMAALLASDFRPKVVCVEFNSAFGPQKTVSIPYTPGLDYLTFHESQLYYGASVMAWRTLFAEHGFRFVTVDSRGVNAFFAAKEAIDLPGELRPLEFAENIGQRLRHRCGWEGQLSKIDHLPLIEVTGEQGGAVTL